MLLLLALGDDTSRTTQVQLLPTFFEHKPQREKHFTLDPMLTRVHLKSFTEQYSILVILAMSNAPGILYFLSLFKNPLS